MNDLNAIDIVTLLVLLWAVIAGWRRGVILQLCSLAGLGLSIYLAIHYGAAAGRALHFGDEWAVPGGFIVVALLTLIAVTLIGHLLRKIFHFAGLGVLDILLGILISLVKWLLLLSVLYTAFAALNRSTGLVEERSLRTSKSFYPVCHLSDFLLPSLNEMLELPEEWIPKNEERHEGA